jgi:hypothetical protein
VKSADRRPSGSAPADVERDAAEAVGRQDEALHGLGRFRDRQPNPAPWAFWNEPEIRLPESEAEAVVLWDPIFPADPFAR